MSDWHPEVIKLGKIEPLPNSDFLEITTVMDLYPVILRKGEYQEGQLVSFLPADTVVPDTEQFHFLNPKLEVGKITDGKRTIKAKQLRGTYSEGLIVPAPDNFTEGQSVIEYFGLKKRIYEEELDDLLLDPKKNKNVNAENEKSPKTFQLFKYDLEGMAKYAYVFEEDEEVIITEKLEGENFSLTYAEGKLWVRSRNYFKRNGSKPFPARTIKQKFNRLIQNIKSFFIKSKNEIALNHWWEFPIRMKLEEKLKNYPYLAIFCELYGNVKHFSYDTQIIDGKRIREARVFDIYDVKKKQFLEWKQVEEMCNKLDLKTVPILYRGKWKTDKSLYHLAEGKSVIGDHVKEGFVMRSVPNAYHPKLGRKIIKLKGRDYKLFKG